MDQNINKRINYIGLKARSFKSRLESFEIFLEEADIDYDDANSRLPHISKLYEESMRYNDELLKIHPENVLIEEFSQLETRYYKVAAKVSKLRRVSLNASLMNASTITTVRDTPKLPTITIPQFSGNHDEWLTFKNTFLDLIDSREDYGDAVKFVHLKNALKGEALKKIAILNVSAQNYSRAWKVLTDSYDRKRLLIAKHLDAIINLPAVPKATAAELSNLIDEAKQHLSLLQQLGADVGNDVVLRILEKCLPIATRGKWEESLELDQFPSLNEFYKFIETSVFRLRVLEQERADPNSNRKRAGEISSYSQIPKRNARTLITNVINRCIKRGENHQLFACPTFNKITIQERWDFVKKQRICRNCLRSHPQPCQNETRCKRCQRDHHTLLHSDAQKPTQGLKSQSNTERKKLEFLVVPEITSLVPNEIFPRKEFNIPKNLQLADPNFHIPQRIELLLGSGTTLSILSVGQLLRTYNNTTIVLQKTSLGWIIAGGSESVITNQMASCNFSKLDNVIERFWVIEGLDDEPAKTRDEIACEEHYVKNTQRKSSGRYVVRLPFRCNHLELGESKPCALKRLHHLERKFKTNENLKKEYQRVMQEYIELEHMVPAQEEVGGYYLPHHAIIKDSSKTTKLRVVFDASAKTSTGLSLNDVLMTGPTLQLRIFEQILKFRTHTYVITADIAKMYRQIIVHPEDRKYQRVLWYNQTEIQTYEMIRLTFGISSAPFLAIRTIQQLAHDEAESFPRASKLLLRDLYVDDFISGANSLEEILQIRNEVIELLSRGGFDLRQWSSNHQAALNDIDKKIFNLDCLTKGEPIQKTLGIKWDSQSDQLLYETRSVNAKMIPTKRNLISEISKLYDPLGLVGPITLYAKVLIQECWKAKLNWDESLPQEIHTKWVALATQLPMLQELSIERKLIIDNPIRIEIHGFCDACQYGYGACLFIRSINAEGIILVRLACAKSRVAPVKREKNVTIPRLELCAATLLKKLYLESKAIFGFSINQTTFWSDSMIVLHWIHKAPHLLKIFESNRVKDLQLLGQEVQWKHIRTTDNPADALSRGQLPVDFVHNKRWFAGPEWLSQTEEKWLPIIKLPKMDIPGLKKQICLFNRPIAVDIYTRFSSYDLLIKVSAWILRWRKPAYRGSPIIIEEKREAELRILRSVQFERFSVEIKRLSTPRRDEANKVSISGERLTTTSVIYRKSTRFDNLHPFLDDEGLVRVGGRLKRANLSYDQKHPILLPSNHHVTDIIIREYHTSTLHAGIQSTLFAIRSRFWILNGKNQVRKIIHKCINCLRAKPKPSQAQMADLPTSRVTEAPAFSHVGIDYFGPLYLKEKKFRNKTIIKAYGCVFICMKSRAVHIELAEDLSTEGFLASFRRFISRRGIPENVYSDNGTNFIGANKELKEIYDYFEKTEIKNSIETYALSKRIKWHFNPPLSPHFGGLWEAAVKSFKHHSQRILKDHFLTFEQMYTLLIEIEAILNSRPLYALSADPNDPIALTPAHVLIGKSFNALPEHDFVSVADNRLSTWNFISKARQHFWKRWHTEYLNELQLRQKWHESGDQIQPGSVVILIDKNASCGRWPLGVVLEVFPGSDGVIRVANIKTANGVYKQNITNLCVLPIS